MTCGVTRVLVVAAGAGMLVASVTGVEGAGWITAAVAGLVVLGLERRAARRGRGTCVPAPRERVGA